MQDIIIENISLILLLPLWIFLIIMCGRFFSVYVNKKVVYFLTLLSSFLGALACSLALINLNETIEIISPFIKINDFIINVGLRIDKFSLIVAILLFVISFAIQLFSISYMKNEKKNYKFFAFLNLFNFGMAFLLFSPNLFQFYVFWEIVGVVSYLLIGFDYRSKEKSDASRRVFLMNRIGDTALITGIIITSYYMYSYAQNISFVTLSFEDFNAISTLLMAYSSNHIFYIICGLFIVGAAVKSAQIPFYTWLQDAMEAKLPVSALLHSATMVVAGVYLVIRMMPFFTLNQNLMNLILIIGFITAIICSILASIEIEPKKVLAYSTSANLGLMFAAIGCKNVKTALIILIAHAFIKSALFILLPKEKTMPKIQFLLFSIAALSLSGIAFAGLSMKEILYKSMEINVILAYTFMFICFVTAFYISRLVLLIYKQVQLKNNTNLIELIAFLILFLGNVSLYIILRSSYSINEPFAAATGGVALALLLGKNNALEKLSNTPKLLEKFYKGFVPYVYEKFTQVLNLIENKVLYNYSPIIFMAKLPIKITNWIEINIMNKSVKLISNASKEISKRDMMLQNGNIQAYNAYAFILITIAISLVIAIYTLFFADSYKVVGEYALALAGTAFIIMVGIKKQAKKHNKIEKN